MKRKQPPVDDHHEEHEEHEHHDHHNEQHDARNDL